MRATAIPVTALLVAGTIWGAAPLRITSVRAWPMGDVTRVVVEATGPFTFRAERLHNPERVFFDIQGARPYIEHKRLYNQALDDKLLKRVRVAETLPGVTRVVLDLESAVEFTASRMSNPERLILELRRGAEPAIPPLAESPQPPPVAAIDTAPPAPAVTPVTEPRPKGAVTPPRSVTPVEVPKAKPPAPTPAETAKGAARLSTGKNSMTRALGLKINRVVIDPGHGGHDQGTVGRQGLMEKELVLDMAQRLGKLVQERLGSEIVYTRTEDVFVPLEGRTAMANDRKADLFISLHANSSPIPRTAGVETFYLNFTTARDALDVAARENASSQKSISELQDVLKKITLQEKIDESRELAGRVQTSLYANSARYVPGARNRGVKKAPFMVLVGARMPAVLVEIGFLSNSREEGLLKRPEHRQRVAEALYRGISRYADGLSHFQVAKKED